MSETVLFVDDEENVLRSIKRIFSPTKWSFRSASSARSALTILRKEDVAVIVSDNKMPGMSGLDLLSQVRAISPSTVKVLMTAHADLDIAVEAINKTEVFRFILKPWDNNELEGVVEECLARYRIIQPLSQGTEATLLSLAQTLELKDPYTWGHCERVGEYAVVLARRLGLSETVLKEIRHGCWLHDCGKIGVPENILNNGGPLSASQYAIVKRHPRWGADVARHGGLPERVISVILHHHEKIDGTGYPMHLKGQDVPLEARIVSVADVYDSLTTDRPYRNAIERSEALEVLCTLKGSALDPDLVDLFVDIFQN